MFNYKITDDSDYQNFILFLKSVSKNETIENHKRHIAILNTKQEVIAIAMSKIRDTANKIFKNGYQYIFLPKNKSLKQ